MPKRTIFLAVAVLSLVGLAQAQTAPSQQEQQDPEKLIELMRKDVRTHKADIISRTMALDAKTSGRLLGRCTDNSRRRSAC